MDEFSSGDDDFTKDAFDQCDLLASQALSGAVTSTTLNSNALNERIAVNSSITSYGTNQSNETFLRRPDNHQTRTSSNSAMVPPSTVSYDQRVPPYVPVQKKETASNDNVQLQKELQQCHRKISELQKNNMELYAEIYMVQKEMDTKEKEAGRKQQESIEKLKTTQAELDEMKGELDRAKTKICFKDQEQLALHERLRSLKSGNRTFSRMPSPPQESPPKRRKVSNERVAAFPTVADFEKSEVKQKSSEKVVQYKAESCQVTTPSAENHTRCELQKKLIERLENVNAEKQDRELLKDIMVAAAAHVRRILVSYEELKSRRRKRAPKLLEEIMHKVQSTSNIWLWIHELTLTEAERCAPSLNEMLLNYRLRSKQYKMQINELDGEVEELLDQLVQLLGARITDHYELCSSVVQLATTFFIYIKGVKNNKMLSIMTAVKEVLLEDKNNTAALPTILLMVKLLKELLLASSLTKHLISNDEEATTIRKLLGHVVHISKRLTLDKSEELCWNMIGLAGCECICEGVAILVLGSLFLVLGDHLNKWKHQSIVLGIDVPVPVDLFSRGIHLCRRLRYKPQMGRIRSQFGPCHTSWLLQVQMLQPIINLSSADVMALSELLREFGMQSPSEEDREVDSI